MAKILNLDEVTAPERVLILEKVEYPMAEITVEQFIKNNRRAKELETSGDMVDQFEMLVDVIAEAFPTCPKEKIRGLSVKKLERIFEWIQDTSSPEEGKEPGKGETTPTK